MTTAIISVDPSSKKLAIAVSWFELDEVAMMTVDLPEGLARRPQACHEAYDEMYRVVEPRVKSATEVYVFIEAPVLGRGGAHATIPQAQINGALQAATHAAGATVMSVNNKTWKKDIVGNGNANKDEIARWFRNNEHGLYAQWVTTNRNGVAAPDQDMIDALCINLYGRQLIARMKNNPDYNINDTKPVHAPRPRKVKP
jgi:Holliday junction resolvasome RuvABC endonuclease subunit